MQALGLGMIEWTRSAAMKLMPNTRAPPVTSLFSLNSHQRLSMKTVHNMLNHYSDLETHKQFYLQSIIISTNSSGLSQATTPYIVILIVFATLGTPVLLTANR